MAVFLCHNASGPIGASTTLRTFEAGENSLDVFFFHIGVVKERARNNISILAAFFSALLRYSSVT
jgi:hypothetical protein